MQSSVAVAGRALIMLACVVGIPAVALSGTSWSEMLKKLQNFHWSELLDFASVSKSVSPGEARPLAGPGVADRGTTGAPPPNGPSNMPQLATAPTEASVVPAGFQGSADSFAGQSVVRATGETATAAASADSFPSIQARLRQLGATYYLLESWGTDERLFRFYCKVAIGGSPDYTRYFESTHGDPLQAMREVLRQVETWRQGGTAKSQRESAKTSLQAGTAAPVGESSLPRG